MQAAATAVDSKHHREAARAAWASIGRRDLIAQHLGEAKGVGGKKK
jgi:hypothetical protein